jgi:hypothetical protein
MEVTEIPHVYCPECRQQIEQLYDADEQQVLMKHHRLPGRKCKLDGKVWAYRPQRRTVFIYDTSDDLSLTELVKSGE